MASKKFEVVLSDDKTHVEFDPENPNSLFEEIINRILIPYYKDSNDWYKSIRKVLNEIDLLRRRYSLPNIDYRKLLIHQIEKHLAEIEKIEGLDKIEILFLNMDDYLVEINQIVDSKELPREDKVKSLGDLIASLNTFELSELMLYFIEKSKK